VITFIIIIAVVAPAAAFIVLVDLGTKFSRVSYPSPGTNDFQVC
jgi:hypothetical protein